MICSTCSEDGSKSRVFSLGTYSTLMGGSSGFWDENGKKHWHDVNERVTKYQCSNGHEWSEVDDNECGAPGCNWSRSAPHA